MTIRSLSAVLLLLVLTLTGYAQGPASSLPANTAKLTPTDLSAIRGANYRGAGAADTTDYWKNYSAAETQRDLGYADRLKLNQLRVFVNEASWNADKPAFRKNLIDLAQACNRHRIGLPWPVCLPRHGQVRPQGPPLGDPRAAYRTPSPRQALFRFSDSPAPTRRSTLGASSPR